MELKNLTKTYFKGIEKKAKKMSDEISEVFVSVLWDSFNVELVFFIKVELVKADNKDRQIEFRSEESFEECLETMGKHYNGEG